MKLFFYFLFFYFIHLPIKVNCMFYFLACYSYGEKFGSCVPIIGMSIVVLFYGRQARKYSFIQELCSLEMWKSCADQKVRITKKLVLLLIYFTETF